MINKKINQKCKEKIKYIFESNWLMTLLEIGYIIIRSGSKLISPAIKNISKSCHTSTLTPFFTPTQSYLHYLQNTCKKVVFGTLQQPSVRIDQIFKHFTNDISTLRSLSAVSSKISAEGEGRCRGQCNCRPITISNYS